MTYEFKPVEALWFVGTAVATAVLEVLIHFDPAAITDWRVWAVGLGAAAVRAGAGAGIAFIAKLATAGSR